MSEERRIINLLVKFSFFSTRTKEILLLYADSTCAGKLNLLKYDELLYVKSNCEYTDFRGVAVIGARTTFCARRSFTFKRFGQLLFEDKYYFFKYFIAFMCTYTYIILNYIFIYYIKLHLILTHNNIILYYIIIY